jgi:hypothetical protein
VTRYAIRHIDGRWLAIGWAFGRVVPIWLSDSSRKTTWPTMTIAMITAMEPQGLNLRLGEWSVQPVPDSDGIPRDC